MKLTSIPTLLCSICGKELRPQQNPLAGVTVVKDGYLDYLHPGTADCSHSEEIYEVAVGKVSARVVGREDWRTLPPKLVAEVQK
jgi:hypothetical protein